MRKTDDAAVAPRVSRVIDMRSILAVVALAVASPSASAIASGQNAVQPLSVMRAPDTTNATCTLIHRHDSSEGVVLYFVTAGRVFKTSDGDRLPQADSIVVGRGGDAVTVLSQDVLVPIGNFVDVALLRVTVPHTDLQPEPVAWDPPSAGSALVVIGFDPTGVITEIAQHVRFESTMLVVGDRDVSHLDGCIGAPAAAADGAFGIVTSCEPGKTPVITLLRAARRFIAYYIPQFAAPPRMSHLSINDLNIIGPTLDVPCTGINAGEIEVPLPLPRDDWVLDITPALIRSEQVHLADIAVVHMDDRSVKLRFSVGGESPSPWAIGCPHAQALVTLRVTLVTTSPE